tara:strand:- start:6115 stop:6543 length:429 start_codon:yes stop_codon:yes gene_type:complete
VQQQQLTVAQAAKLYGKARSTVHRAMKAGRVSSTVRGDGTRVIAFSELLRVWGEPVNSPTKTQRDATGTPSLTQQASVAEMTQLLSELVELTKRQADELAGMREELRELRRLPAPEKLDQPDAERCSAHLFAAEMAALKARK